MSHAFLTVAIPFEAARADDVEARLIAMGNPPVSELRQKLDHAGTVHFMSAVVIRDTGTRRCHLLLEVSADGTEEQAAQDVAREVTEMISQLEGQPAAL